MFNIELPWKEFNISLPELEVFCRTTAEANYVGCSANSSIQLHFTEEPSEEIKEAIQTFYEEMTNEGYKSQQQIVAEEKELQETIKTAKLALISKTWAQMSTVERKLVMNLEVTREEMGL